MLPEWVRIERLPYALTPAIRMMVKKHMDMMRQIVPASRLPDGALLLKPYLFIDESPI
jgi:hypothetical protein